MTIEKNLKSIFGVYPSVKADLNRASFTLEMHIQELNEWLAVQMHNEEHCSPTTVDERNRIALVAMGCLGPTTKAFVMPGTEAGVLATHHQSVSMSKDRLTVVSKSVFATLKANCCVFRGRWMYEVHLRTKGIMQIGFCSAQCAFSSDCGVGDTRNSYSWDGSKQRLWHVQTKKFGPQWYGGDIIGVCLDMDAGTMAYQRNGQPLGEAFDGIERGAGIAMFPAVSLGHRESLTANFGGTPFRYPVAGYQPLQAVPHERLHNADVLLRYTVALAGQIRCDRMSAAKAKKQRQQQPSPAAVHLVVAGLLVGPLRRLLNDPYVIEDRVLACMQDMCAREQSNPSAAGSTLNVFLSLLWLYWDGRDTKMFISHFVLFLCKRFRMTPTNMAYESQRSIMRLLTSICHHEETRRYLLDCRFFKKNCLAIFLHIRPPDNQTLAELLPERHTWTAGIGPNGARRDAYLAACERLQHSTDVLYAAQTGLLQLLLSNDDQHDSREQQQPTSRRIFVTRMRRYVEENCQGQRSFDMSAGSVGAQVPSTIAMSFVCIVLDVLRRMFATNATVDPHVQPTFFYNSSSSAVHDRIGGLFAFLTKTFSAELAKRLGETPAGGSTADTANMQPTSMPSATSLYSAIVFINGASTAAELETASADQLHLELTVRRLPIVSARMEVGPIDETVALNDLLDCCIMYYNEVAHKYVVMVADLRDNIGTLSDALVDIRLTLDMIPKTSNELRGKFEHRHQVFVQRSIELAREQAWCRAFALNGRRRDLLQGMLHSVFRTLVAASQDGCLFAFVPEPYVVVLPQLLDACLDFGHHDLAAQYELSPSMDAVLRLGTEFLSGHAFDDRILLATCRDAMLLALGTLTCHAAGMRQLEQVTPLAQRRLAMDLLRPYENRAWGQSNWLLIRFWLGDGFGFRDARATSVWQSSECRKPDGLLRSRGKMGSHMGLLHHVAPACPSRHYQQLIGNVLLQDEPLATVFVNSILSQLNWAFSEFVLLLQEIANNAQHQDPMHLSEMRSLKVSAMCFELTISLMRSLEMIVTIAPAICLDPRRSGSELMLNRSCQLLSQVFARVCAPAGLFQQVVDLCLPDLAVVTHLAIVSAAIGILMALLVDEMNDDPTSVTRVARILLTDPSFELAHLECVLDTTDESPAAADETTACPKPVIVPKGNFDPKMRAHIDPLTNEVRVPNQRTRRPDKPIVQFSLVDYASHVDATEIQRVRRLIEMLRHQQALLSNVTLSYSEENLCPICYSKSVSAVFEPCQHQSCANCIVLHLMNHKVCFYCKTQITKVSNSEGVAIYECLATDAVPQKPPPTG